MKNCLKPALLLPLFLFFSVYQLYAESEDTTMTALFDMSIEELINTQVSIATKSSQKLSEAPSIVSVITADDIQNMGAREMEDVLQTIPGFELTRSYAGYYNIGVRGVKDSRITSKLLIMIDGVPFNQIFYGSYAAWGYDINLDIIERIEIIRGPGSALYGRNAFSAVINIITKDGNSDEKLLLKSSIGTFNAKSLSGYLGYNKNKLNASIAIRQLNTDVTDVKFDEGSGIPAKWNLYRDNLWLNTKLGYGKFLLSAMYLDLKGGALFTQTNIYNKIGSYSISFQDNISSNLSIHTKIFGHNSGYTEDIEQMKPDVHPAYTEGIYYTPHSQEYLYGIETELKYKLSPNNDLLFGFQADIHGVEDVTITSNIDMVTFAPLQGIGRDNQVIYEPGWFENNEHDYNNIAFFIQNVWYPVNKIGITYGGRYDLDSEIGGVINPRVGLVLEPIKNANLKLLYGRAYRAPAPADQYVTLGYAIGNKDLKPEIINTLELAFNYRYQKMTHTISLYRNRLTDMIYSAQLIQIDPNNKYYNIGENTSTGVEYENKLILGKNFYSYINYSFTESVNSDLVNGIDTTYNHPDVAPHKFNAGVNYKFFKYFNLNINMIYRSEMSRFKIIGTNDEVENTIGNYTIINSTLQIDNLVKNFNISLSAYNLLDKKYYSQDNQHYNQPPQSGRQIILSIIYSLK